MNDNGTNLLERVNNIIDHLRPYLQSDGGDIEVIKITEEKTVIVRLTGACGNCPFSENTMKAGVEQAIRKEIPEIKEVIAIN
jgi:Fe-S cluster biogenesis protein NfuA